MNGVDFYQMLFEKLVQEQPLSGSGSYTFVKWDADGSLTYRVENSTQNPKPIKKIEIEIIVMTKYWQKKDIDITYDLLKSIGHNHYCTPPVLKYLLDL